MRSAFILSAVSLASLSSAQLIAADVRNYESSTPPAVQTSVYQTTTLVTVPCNTSAPYPTTTIGGGQPGGNGTSPTGGAPGNSTGTGTMSIPTPIRPTSTGGNGGPEPVPTGAASGTFAGKQALLALGATFLYAAVSI